MLISCKTMFRTHSIDIPALVRLPVLYYTQRSRRSKGKSNAEEGNSMAAQDLPLAGKIALVTGSSQGIGRATALRLAQSGADIIVNYRSNSGAAAEVKDQIAAAGRRCIAVQADVSQEEDVNRLFAEANSELGGVTILVNNAGTTRDKLILQMTSADFDFVIQTNLRSAFLCTKAALRGMMKARWGRIVNIS